MSDQYSQLVSQIFGAIANDDYDQSERLANVYLSADEAGKELLDQAFMCLCGWKLATLMEQVGAKGPVALLR